MPKSILREPPAGSELAARFATFQETSTDGGDPTPALMRSHPVLREAYELFEVLREPRLWKLPTEWIARHDLPERIRLVYGEEAAAELQSSPRLGQVLAEQLQALDYFAASAQKRAKEPRTDQSAVLRSLVVAEFMNVASDMPGASLTRHYAETARRLSTRRGKIDRGAVRRAVEGHVAETARLPSALQQAIWTALLFLADAFRAGAHRAA